jgi:hypothetical protein
MVKNVYYLCKTNLSKDENKIFNFITYISDTLHR